MKSIFSSSFTIGVLGGGQLGKMLLQEAYRMDIRSAVLDPAADASCAVISNDFVQGSFADSDTVFNFGKDKDVVTIEIEHVSVDGLRRLKSAGVSVFPDPEVLATIQNKQLQKSFYQQHAFPTADWFMFDSVEQLRNKLASCNWSFPFIWKSATMGYDGKGVKMVRTADDLQDLPDVPGIAENAVDIQVEIAVIVVRGQNGDVKCFPACEMFFKEEANLVEFVSCPSFLDASITSEAESIARSIADKFGTVGLLAVELFVTKSGKILVNEVAPRPHNSGHFTIEACYSSQYEQHLRAICGLPLGDTSLKSPSVMYNLVGEADASGDVWVEGAEKLFGVSGASLHLYGKKTVRPFRKMGHVTVCATSVDEAMSRAKEISGFLKITSK